MAKTVENLARVAKELNALKYQVTIAEKDVTNCLQRQYIISEIAQLVHHQKELNNTILDERQMMNKNLETVKRKLKIFQTDLNDMRSTPDFVAKLKRTLEECETSINATKQQHREISETLKREESVLGLELSGMDRRIETWMQNKHTGMAVSKKQYVPTSNAVQATDNSVPKEIAEFNVYVSQHGGHTGMWEESDHQVFVRLYKKHKTLDKLLIEADSVFPGYTEVQIKKHYWWYKKYLELVESKKTAIEKWKEEKQEKKKEEMQSVIEKVVQATPKLSSAQLKKFEDERRERQKKVFVWKELKRKQEEKELQEAKEKELKEKKLKSQAEQLRQAQIKAQVEEYHLQKQEEIKILERELKLKNEKLMEEKKQEIAAELSRFRRRDRKALKEKLELEQVKAHEAEEKEKQLDLLRQKVKSKLTTERDPTRLLQPTKLWEERQKQKEENPTEEVPQNFVIPHRAVPVWRDGL